MYSDSILNGVKIFRLSWSSDLAGPNPDPISNLLEQSKQPIGKSGKNRKIIIAVVSPFSTFFAISLLFFLIIRKRSNICANSSRRAVPDCDICFHFSLSEIQTATNNFDRNFIMGIGGFGEVYRGLINVCSTPVAIKRLNPGSKQGVLEFRIEIEMLSQLRHQNLVSLIGYCEDERDDPRI
ncbi:hypothetical protein DITRI_Ditri11bG0030300 [Diplodiscus trichospermus]